MTNTLPPVGQKIARPDGGMDQTWYEALRKVFGFVDKSTDDIAGLGTAATKNIATEAEVRAYDDSEKIITTGAVRSSAAFAELVFASTVELDWKAGATRTLTMSGDAILGTPVDAIPGTFMTIYVIGNDGTDRTLTYASSYGGIHPATDDIDNAKAYVLTMLCISASHFVITAVDGSPP